MSYRFQEQLHQLQIEMVKMGALCETAISAAAKALLEQDTGMAEKATATEQELDRREQDIERLCMELLLSQQLSVKELRSISAALKMLSDLERIGDQAADIAELTISPVPLPETGRHHITDMARIAVAMVTNSVDAFVRSDLDMAADVIETQVEMVRLFHKAKADVAHLIREGNPDVDADRVLDLLMVARHLERIGGHAELVAEWVRFAVTGQKRPGEGPALT